jgi:hypothetical protein
MATTMNIFEYFHYMTSFIDELVEKHGYDRDVIVNTWRSQNEKWMTLEAEKPKATTAKGGTEKCSFILQSGKNKGNQCSKNAMPDTKMCKTHALKTSSDDDDTHLVTKKKPATDETTEKCIVNLKTGKNKGTACGKNVIPGTHTCKSHTSNAITTKKTDDEKSDDDDNEIQQMMGDDNE